MVSIHGLPDMQIRERYYSLPPTTFFEMPPTEQVGPASIHKCAYSNCSIT